MKKKIVWMLIAICLLCMVGCKNDVAGPAAGTPLSQFYDRILAAQPQEAEALIFFEESDPGMIESFYPGLADVELSQQAYYVPPVITAPCEIMMVEVANGDDVQTVVDIFKARIQRGADNTAYPESAAGWQKNAQVQQIGNFVCMIVLPDTHIIPENVFEVHETK